ncbi:MAG: CrcB family protein [Pirellulales bacterium]
MLTDSLWLRIFVVAAAGACGALARWGTNEAVHAIFGRHEPWNWGTVAVNVAGCFLFGLVFVLVQPKSTVSIAVLIGFLGAFTTFSAFAFDTHLLMIDRGLLAATLNVTIHVAFGLIALVLGMALGRTVF